jgi:HPt (histidine-containing phosphotransfer) domain-containing protein
VSPRLGNPMINRASNSDQPCVNGRAGSATGGNIPATSGELRPKSGALAFDLLETNLGRDAALEVLNSFICFARTSIDELRQSARKQNVEQSRSLAKELGSSCRVIGASSLLRSCLLLEEELQDPDWLRVRQYVEAVAAETKAVSMKLRQLLS